MLVAVVFISIISAGVFDPLAAELPITDPGTVILSAASGEQAVHWTPYLLEQSGTIRVTAQMLDGDDALVYGLLLGDSDQGLTIGLSPVGYLAILITRFGQVNELLPRQTWPHARHGRASNEIEVIVEREKYQIWVNREVAWQGTLPKLPPGVGFSVASEQAGGSASFSKLTVLSRTEP